MTKTKSRLLAIFTHFNVLPYIEGLFEMALFCGDFTLDFFLCCNNCGQNVSPSDELSCKRLAVSFKRSKQR